MGWCSATEIFDTVAKAVLPLTELHDYQKITILRKTIEVLADGDWDCESDSTYWTHPLVRQSFKSSKYYNDWDWDEIEEEEKEDD